MGCSVFFSAIQVGGRQTTPRQELKELFSAIEEAKADVTSPFMLQHLYDRGLLQGRGAKRAAAVQHVSGVRISHAALRSA
jgi:hypothetical protein